MYKIIPFLMLSGCTNLWILPGQSPWSNTCGNIEAFNYTLGSEIWGNGFDDTCDGLIDPGNGSYYVEIHNDETTANYLEFYNNAFPEEGAFSNGFLNPRETWEVTFLLITEFDAADDSNDWIYLYGSDNSTLGYRSNNTLEFIYEIRSESATHRIIQKTNLSFTTNTILTIQYAALEELTECPFNNVSFEILSSNRSINADAPILEIEGDGDENLGCIFTDVSSPVTFGGRDTLPLGFKAFHGAVDDLVIAEYMLETEERNQLIAQIQEAYFNPYSFRVENDRTGFEDLVWHTIDLSNGSCEVGFMDYISDVNLKYVSDPCMIQNHTIDVIHIEDPRYEFDD